MGTSTFARYLRYSAFAAALLAATTFGGTAAGAAADATTRTATRTGAAAHPLGRPAGGTTTTKSTAVDYLCFVTFTGGSTTVQFSLTYSATAPDSVGPFSLYAASISFPAITPNPSINVAVQDLRAVFTPPAGTRLLTATATGGSGVGPAGARVTVRDNAAVVTAQGPFPAGTAFTLPTLRLNLLAGANGSGAVNAAGVTLADPQFSWVRTDPADGTTQRPFACFTTPVPLTTTVIAGGGAGHSG
jgi:dehydratase